MQKFEPALLEQIKSLVPISSLVGEYVAAAPKSSPGDLWGLCPVHQERTPSFHAEDAIGLAHCFGCGFNDDHFGFLEKVAGMTFPQAVEAVADMAGVTLPGTRSKPSAPAPRAKYEASAQPDPYATYTLSPAPADTPPIEVGKRTPKLRNPKHAGTAKFETTYVPDEVSPYHDAEGNLLGYVLRMDTKTGKITPGIWWMKCEDGWEGWSHGSLGNKRPLNNLQGLIAQPDLQVLVVGGERKRRMAAEALAGKRIVVISWMGGDNAVAKTDWSPLEGRRIVWWADNDDSGRIGMSEAKALARGSENKTVKPYGTKGGDVADLITDGGSVADYIKANISEWKDAKHDTSETKHTSRRDGSNDAPPARATSNRNESVDKNVGRAKDAEPARKSTVHESAVGIGQDAVDDHPDSRTHSQPHPQPSPATEDHKASAQGLGHVGREAYVEEIDWEGQLQYTKSGEGLDKSSLVNAALMLEYHPTLKGIYAWNDFSKEIAIMRKPPWERKWSGTRLIKETDITSTAMQMEFLGIKPKRSDMAAIIAQVSEYNRFNPVVDALEKLTWDGVPRLMGGQHGKQKFAPMSVRYFGTDTSNINAVFFAKTMIGAVARAYDPGCKLDTALILEGGQGAGKSTAIEALSNAITPGVYTDEIADPGSKDAGLQIQGRWLVEISELDAFRRSENSTIKSWISRKTDKFRRPYGKIVEDFLRSCAFIGSVNPPPHGYLKDATGGRRFWPVRVGEIDMPLLREDAVQLWAEARHLYLDGEPWHLVGNEVKEAEIVQAARLEGDPWNPLIASFVDSHQMSMKSRITVSEIMGSGCINIPSERRTVTQTARIEAYLSGPLRWTRVGDGIYQRPT